MAKGNLLVNGKNNVTARNKFLTDAQTRLANTNTASNVTTTPNLPTTRTSALNLGLQKAQQPVQTKLNNLNNATLPTQNVTSNNPAFVNGQLANQNTSRFIGFQKPQLNTDLAGNIVNQNGNILNTAQQGKSWAVEQSKPILNIPTVKGDIDKENAKEEKRYRTMSEAFLDLQGDLYKNKKILKESTLKANYPEFDDLDINVLNELQKELLPIVKSGKGVDPDQISQYYSELLKPIERADETPLKEQEAESKKIKDAKKRADKLLNSNNSLSQFGTRYLQDVSEVSDYLDYIRNNYRLPNNPSDSDILAWGQNNIPELKKLLVDMQQLESLGGMTNADWDIIHKNGFDMKEWLGDAANWLQGATDSIQDYTASNSAKWQSQLKDLGFNSSAANAITQGINKGGQILSIPMSMGGQLAGGINEMGTSLEKIAKQQNLTDEGKTDLNGIVSETINLGGGTLSTAFNTVYAPITALYHVAGTTEIGEKVTNLPIDTVAEGWENVLDGSFEQSLGGDGNNLVTRWFNSLDEKTKSNILNELTYATFHAGNKVSKSLKVEGEVLVDAVSNALKEGKNAAKFQAWVEKGLANENGKFQKGAVQRIANEGISEFSSALKRNFRLFDTVVKNRKGEITSSMDTLPDNRTIKEKAESKFNEIKQGAKDTVNDIIDTTKEGVEKGVDLAKEGINKGVETVKEGVETVKNKVTSKKETEIRPTEEETGWSNNKSIVGKATEGITKAYDATLGKAVDAVSEKGAEIITSTTSPQDKLFQAVSPTLNKLTNKRGNYNQKRQNADRTNELIVEYGHEPTNTAEYYKSLISTKQDLWQNEIQRGLDAHKYTTVDVNDIIKPVREALSDDAKFPLASNRADLELLEREFNNLLELADKDGNIPLDVLEAIKQQINAKVNYGKNPTAGEVFEKGLREINRQISLIEDRMISELPGEFTKFKKDYGALKDMEEDVLKMMLKSQKKKSGGGLIQNRGRIEGLGKLASKPIEGILQFMLGESLGKAKDVDFLIQKGFADLKKQYKGKKKNLKVKKKDEGEANVENTNKPTPKAPTETPKNKITSKKPQNEEKSLEKGGEDEYNTTTKSSSLTSPGNIRNPSSNTPIATTFSKGIKSITVNGKQYIHHSGKYSFKTNHVFKQAGKNQEYVDNFNKAILNGDNMAIIGNDDGHDVKIYFDQNFGNHFVKHGGYPAENLVETINNYDSKDVNKGKFIYQKQLPNGNRLRAIVSRNYTEISFFESKSQWKPQKNNVTAKNNDILAEETPQRAELDTREADRIRELEQNETPQIDDVENLVTDKAKITTKKQEPKANGGMQRQIGEARNAVFTNTILDIIESNGGLKDGYLKVEKKGYEPLYIEEIGGGRIAIGQTYIQEGDVMFDPEIVFKVDDEGRLQAETYRNDSMGVYEQPIKSNDPFLETRETNLREFIKEGESVDKQKNTNIIGKNNSLTTKQQNNGGKDLGTAQSGASKGVQGDKGSRNLQGADGLPGTKGNDSGRSGGDLHQEQHDNGSIVKGQSAGPAIGQQQGKLLTRGEARAINQSSKDILEKHNFSTNPKDYTAEEIETLRQYEGAGGLTNKGEDTTGVLDQFYTPQTAIDAVWNLVDKYKTDKGDDMYYVLEPTVGTGRFIRDRKNEMYEGHEIDKVPGTIAQILHPMAYIRIGDFEDNFMDFTGRRPQERAGNKLDIVVGNPPYSQRISKQQKAGLEPNIKRSEEFFIKKGIDVLKDGGILAMVVPSTFLTNPMTYAKEQIFNNATLIDAYRLPEGVFPYTQVGTDIVVFKKVKGIFRENKLSDNKRFEEHPEKILGEVKERVNRFGKLEKYVDGGDHPLDKLHAIYEDGKVVDTPKEQAQNYNPPKTEERTDVKEKNTTEVTGTKNKVTSKPVEKKKPVKKSNKIENQTIIRGDKTDLGDSVFGQGEIDNRLLEYSKKTDVNGYVEGPVTELVENDPKNLNFYKYHAVTNDLYFAGDIYEKLEQLERDKPEMSEAQYKKQKEGLEAVMPEPYTVENPPFVSPLDQNVMEIETNEIGNVWDRETANYVDKNLPLKDVFLERFRRNVSSSTMNKNLAREYINGDAMRSTSGGGYGLSDEEKAAKARHEKSVVMEQVNEIFNDWLRNKLDRDVQQKILDKFNRENRSYVVPKYDKMPLAARGISKTFNGKTFTPQPGQIEGINFLLSKGAGIVAHGVGHGKTIEGVVATREAQLRGWNKRPLIVAPGPTLYAQWVRTIKELYPDWEIVNLGGLTKSDIKRLRDELGDDPRNWVKDGQVAIISMQGFGDHIEFKPKTQAKLEAELHDVMETKDLNVRQSESLNKKISAMLTPGKGMATEKHTYSVKGEFLRTMYNDMVDFDKEKEEMRERFRDHVKNEYPDLKDEIIDADFEALWLEKPVFLEDLGIDHITVDEMHNFKNVFTSAKMEENESGKKEVNRYGQIIQGNSSARGQKMYLATQYIMNNNNNRNVFGLTATPFNNQPIEMYNMLSFVGKNELEKMGLTNINDFFSRFAEFKEGLAPKASGTELEYKFIMKDFANARDLQRTITQFVNYKGDSEDLIKPEKKLKVPVLKMSELQKDVQTKMEILALEKKDKGDVLKATNGMISNLVSPFIVAGTRAPTGWEDFLDNSPKLKYFADVLKQLRKSGKEDGMFIYMPVGQDFHELYAEALSKYAGVPGEKIGIIDSKTSAKKDEIAEKFRSGEINVLIGGKNTAEGIDLQNNGYITAITSVGWNPTERVQVDGRVWRQGNYNNEVLSVVPLIENSADVIFMGKADQKGSRINNALEQMLFGGDGDLSPEEMMMSLLTEPEKKARTQINMQKQEMDKEIYGLNSQKDRLKELKERIKDSELDPEEIQKQIDTEKAAGRTWSIPRLKNELKNAKGAKEWVAAYKENNGDLPNIEDIDKQILDIEKQVDEIRAAEHELDTNEDMFNNLVDEIKAQQAENSKGVKSYEQYIDDIKADFANAKRFGSKEELKQYLDTKRKNVIANDKNKITSK